MGSPVSFGIVNIAALDLRRRPDHRSEMRSQLLLGEIVRRLAISEDGRWWQIENRADGYVGWIRIWGIVRTDSAGVAAWTRRARARIVVPFAEARARADGGALVSPLVWNCRLVSGKSRGGHRSIELPDGRRGWIPSPALEVGKQTPPSITERVDSLLGVPYLWGGRTPMGMDCSGFTQQVLAEQGIAVPRDADQQFRAAFRLAGWEEARLGDLCFFGTGRGPLQHVGLCLGRGRFAHARGRVRINSLVPGNHLCDKELTTQFRAAGRPKTGAA